MPIGRAALLLVAASLTALGGCSDGDSGAGPLDLGGTTCVPRVIDAPSDGMPYASFLESDIDNVVDQLSSSADSEGAAPLAQDFDLVMVGPSGAGPGECGFEYPIFPEVADMMVRGSMLPADAWLAVLVSVESIPQEPILSLNGLELDVRGIGRSG